MATMLRRPDDPPRNSNNIEFSLLDYLSDSAAAANSTLFVANHCAKPEKPKPEICFLLGS